MLACIYYIPSFFRVVKEYYHYVIYLEYFCVYHFFYPLQKHLVRDGLLSQGSTKRMVPQSFLAKGKARGGLHFLGICFFLSPIRKVNINPNIIRSTRKSLSKKKKTSTRKWFMNRMASGSPLTTPQPHNALSL